jgi:paired small multidrug resistance pump
MDNIANYVGIIGVMLTLFAFFYCQIERWKFDSYQYLLANSVGSCAILFSLFYHWNLPAFLMEVAWLGTSILGIVRTVHKKIDKG